MRLDRLNPFTPLGWALAIGTICLIVAACGEAKKAFEAAATPNPTHVNAVVYKEYGNGVYYFPSTGDEYILALEKFYGDNPTLHCDYQGSTEKFIETPWADGKAYTLTTGHILHCHDIAVPAQDVTVP